MVATVQYLDDVVIMSRGYASLFQFAVTTLLLRFALRPLSIHHSCSVIRCEEFHHDFDSRASPSFRFDRPDSERSQTGASPALLKAFATSGMHAAAPLHRNRLFLSIYSVVRLFSLSVIHSWSRNASRRRQGAGRPRIPRRPRAVRRQVHRIRAPSKGAFRLKMLISALFCAKHVCQIFVADFFRFFFCDFISQYPEKISACEPGARRARGRLCRRQCAFHSHRRQDAAGAAPSAGRVVSGLSSVSVCVA